MYIVKKHSKIENTSIITYKERTYKNLFLKIMSYDKYGVLHSILGL